MKRVAVTAGIVVAVLVGSAVVWIASGDDGSERRTAALVGVEPLAEGVRGMLRWRGGFDCDTQYEQLDVVVLGGSSYVARERVDGCVKPPNAPWDLMAQAGSDGAAGAQGPQGRTGAAGTFSGTYASPDGRFTLSVTNTGISLKGPGTSVELDATAVKAKADGTARIDAGATAEVKSSGQLTVNGAIVKLGGSSGCSPVAKVGDRVTGQAMIGSPTLINGQIAAGSPTVLAC